MRGGGCSQASARPRFAAVARVQADDICAAIPKAEDKSKSHGVGETQASSEAPTAVAGIEWKMQNFALGDMDADGDMDLVRDYDASITDHPTPFELVSRDTIYRNEGGGRLTEVGSVDSGLISDALWADINGDSRADLVYNGREVQWFASVGSAGVESVAQRIPSPGDFSLVAADLDLDKDLDLVAIDSKSRILIQQNQTVALQPRGDLNRDGKLSVADIDQFSAWTQSARELAQMDLVLDGEINEADRERLVRELVGIPYGDANADQVFNSTDLVALFAAGLYETDASATWASGDFNGDGQFDSLDLVLAMQGGAYRT